MNFEVMNPCRWIKEEWIYTIDSRNGRYGEDGSKKRGSRKSKSRNGSRYREDLETADLEMVKQM